MKNSLRLLGLYRYSKTEKKLVASPLCDWHSISKPRISYTRKYTFSPLFCPWRQAENTESVWRKSVSIVRVSDHRCLCPHINPSCSQVGWWCTFEAWPCLHTGKAGVVKIPIYPSVWEFVLLGLRHWLIPLCDLFGNNAFGVRAVSLFTVVRQSIWAEPVGINKGGRTRTSETSGKPYRI